MSIVETHKHRRSPPFWGCHPSSCFRGVLLSVSTCSLVWKQSITPINTPPKLSAPERRQLLRWGSGYMVGPLVSTRCSCYVVSWVRVYIVFSCFSFTFANEKRKNEFVFRFQKWSKKNELVFSFFVRKFENRKGKDGIYTDPTDRVVSLTLRVRSSHALCFVKHAMLFWWDKRRIRVC